MDFLAIFGTLEHVERFSGLNRHWPTWPIALGKSQRSPANWVVVAAASVAVAVALAWRHVNFLCVCQQMPIFMVRLPGCQVAAAAAAAWAASGGSLSLDRQLRLSRAINLQKWPGPAALTFYFILFVFFLFFIFVEEPHVRDETWQSV